MTDKQRAVTEALRLVGEGMSANKAAQQVGAANGVGRQAVQSWAKKAGTPLGGMASVTAKNAREVAEAEYKARRARLRVDMLKVAEKVLARIDSCVRGDRPETFMDAKEGVGRTAQALSVSLGILVDKIRLEEGEVTSRSETWSADEWTRQLKMLEAQVANAGPTA